MAEPASVTNLTQTGMGLILELSARLDPRSVQPEAFAISSLGDAGWADVAIVAASYDAEAAAIEITLAVSPTPPWQLIAYGTGRTPLMDAELRPLGGGRDYVHVQTD